MEQEEEEGEAEAVAPSPAAVGDNAAAVSSALFAELASEVRCSIVLALYSRQAKLSALARELDTTVQDVYRNINRLAQAGLVRRADGNNFELTEMGRMAARQIPFFHFLAKNGEFINKHAIVEGGGGGGGLPDKFVQRMGELEGCRPVSSMTLVLERLKKLESDAHRWLKIMIAQAWSEEGRILAEAAGRGVEVWVLAGRNTVFPREVIEATQTLDKLRMTGRVNARMVDSVPAALYVSDSQAAIVFPSFSGGAVEMSSALMGDDERSRGWCLDLFDHMWQESVPFDIKKTTIV